MFFELWGNLGPIAIGTDGGGLVRIPSAICCVVGLKPTYGLIDLKGCFASHLVSWCFRSFVFLCPQYHHIISKETNGDRILISLEAEGLGDGNLRRVKMGIYWEYFNHADEEEVRQNKLVVSQLKALRAEIVDIKIPELENSHVAHLVSFVSEVMETFGKNVEKHFSDFT